MDLGRIISHFRPLLVVLIAVAALIPAAAPAAAAQPTLSFRTVAFGTDQVDATSGAATVDLTWTLADRDGGATTVSGVVYIQQFNRSVPVGSERLVYYGLGPDEITDTWAVSGNAALSNYSYAFPVPRYGPAVSTSWRVVRITAQDDSGNTLSVAGRQLDHFHLRFVAIDLVDSTVPTLGFVGRQTQQEEFVYDGGTGATARYAVEILDAEAGFWKGRVFLTGPGGVQVSTPIVVVDTANFVPSCGGFRCSVVTTSAAAPSLLCPPAARLAPGLSQLSR